MGNRVAGQRFKDDIGLAAPLDLAARGDALGIREQDDLQQDGGILGRAAGVAVAVFGMKHRQIQLVFDQVVHRMFKGAGLELFLVVDHDHGILIVVAVLETRHADGSLSVYSRLANPSGNFWGFSTAPTPAVCAALEWRRARNGKGVAVSELAM